MGFKMKRYVVDVYEHTKDGIEGWNAEEVWATDAEDAFYKVRKWREQFNPKHVRLADRKE